MQWFKDLADKFGLEVAEFEIGDHFDLDEENKIEAWRKGDWYPVIALGPWLDERVNAEPAMQALFDYWAEHVCPEYDKSYSGQPRPNVLPDFPKWLAHEMSVLDCEEEGEEFDPERPMYEATGIYGEDDPFLFTYDCDNMLSADIQITYFEIDREEYYLVQPASGHWADWPVCVSGSGHQELALFSYADVGIYCTNKECTGGYRDNPFRAWSEDAGYHLYGDSGSKQVDRDDFDVDDGRNLLCPKCGKPTLETWA